jgi:sensor histidine kinase YesM
LFSILIGALAGYIYYLTAQLLDNWLHWKKQTGLRFSAGFLVQAVLIAGFVILTSWAIGFFFNDNNSAMLSKTFGDIHWKLLIISAFLVFLAEIVEFAFFSFNYFTTIQIEDEKQKRRLLNLQFEALKSQLSPHYLFNSLNTVSSLLYRDGKIAEKFIRNLAGTFQYILQTHQKKLISLSNEIEMVEAYAKLMDVRFEGSFHLTIDIDPKPLDTKIPPLTLQMLLENALKHNQMSEEEPLKVSIAASSDNYLEVSNPFRPKPGHIVLDDKMLRKPPVERSMKIGLENIRKRYAFFTDDKVIMECKENFIVLIPLIPKSNET